MRRITKLWTTLLLLCVVGVANAATEYEIDQKFTTLAELDGNFFAIADETAQTAMGIGVSGHNNGWDMYFGTYTETYAANACYYKLEAAQGDGVEGYYYLRTYKADGNMYTAWGNTSTMGFFNSQAATGTCCFALGVSDKNGQDITNGAVWAIEASEGKFALKNIGTGLYLHSDNLPAKYEDAFYFTFCTLKAGAEVPDPDPEPEPDAPLADGEIIPDFFSICGEGDIPYGYNVNFNSEDRAYPKHYDGGPRIFIFGEGGDFTRGIYFREGYVQYGDVKKLALEAGKKYIVYFNSAMWKSSGTTLDFSIFNENDLENAVLTQTINNAPDVNGSRDAVTGSTRSEIEFIPEVAGNYILKWNAEGWKEVLLANVGVKVIDVAPVAQDVTFDFNASNHAVSDNNGGTAGDIDVDEVNTVNGVVMTITPSEGQIPNRYWKTTSDMIQLRMYGGKMTIEAPEGKAITKVVIENGKWNVGNTFNGEAAAEGTWEGNSTNVVLAVAANTQMNKVIVTLADKNEGTTTYKEPLKPLFDDGKYYINNVGTKKYMAAGADWGTHAVVNELGLDYTVAFTPEGKYTLDSQVSNGGDKHFLNGEYNDGLAFGWTFAKVADGIYTISDGAKFLTAGEDGKVTLAEDGTVEAAQWTLIPAADRRAAQIASLADATAENPIDATFLFVDANFNRNDLRKSAWTGDDFAVGGTETNTNAEKWGGNSQTFDVKQTVEVPNGIYKITWNGYYRYNNTTENTNDVAAAAHADGSEVINSFVYLNDQDYPLTSIADEAAVAAFEKMPFSQADATAAFEKGLYEQSAEVTVEDGQLTIGIKKTEHPGCDWTVWDNFRLSYFGAPVTVNHTWDFTKWSEETVTNLKAEAVKVTVVDDPDNAGKTLCTDNDAQWSDHEKKPGMACETYAASKDNCFWSITTPDENGELAANGVTIAELKGLSFNSTYSTSRALAIAVNYPTTSLGTYNGPAYLWFGGKNQEILTIKNVKAGTAITMGVESHKPAETRGVQLFVAGEELKDAEGNAVAAPTTYVEQTWAVPAGEGVVDVVVKNTNGCHIYFIDAEIGEAAPEVNPDEPELVAPEGWTSEITNGNLAGDDVSNYVSKEYPSTTPVASAIVAGAGKNGSRGILVKSQDKASQPWDSQFWIKVNEQLPAGTKVHVEFDFKADKAGSVGTQTHGEPGSYLPGTAIGNVSFTTEWQHFSGEFDVATESNNMQSIAFNLNDIAEANNFYFDNFGVWVQKPKPVEKWADLIVNGDMEGESMECFYVTEQGVGGPFVAVATEGIGKDGGKAVKVQSADKPSQDWDTQFFVRLPYELPAGTKFKFSFDYKSDVAGSADTQCHNEPGQYIHYTCAGSPNFTNEWQHYEYEGMVASQCDGSDNKNEAGEFLYKKDFQTIAFNLAKNQVATVFIFDNVKFEVEESIVSSLTKDPAVDPKPYPVGIKTVNASKEDGLYYDLQGRRVAKPARGLYIINGKKVMVK